MERCDVLVVGGGLAGASVAYELVRRGVDTLLVDRRDPGYATGAGAGILSPETSGDGPGWWELVHACGEHYPEVVASLDERETGYARCGALTLALADWDVDAWEAVRATAHARGGVEDVTPEDAVAAFPALGNVTRALFNPRACRVDGRQMASALLEGGVARGLRVQPGSVGRIVPEVEVDGATVSCGAVVIAGGAWTPALAAHLGVDLPITPVRGQIVHVRTQADTATWPIVQPVLGAYLVPWPGGRVAVGATHETDAGFETGPTVLGMRQMFREIGRVAPGLAEATFVEVRVGLRPFCADDRPVLGPLPGHSDVHVASGYGANGLLLSPWCGAQVAAEVAGETPDPLVERLRPDRFA